MDQAEGGIQKCNKMGLMAAMPSQVSLSILSVSAPENSNEFLCRLDLIRLDYNYATTKVLVHLSERVCLLPQKIIGV